MVANADQLTAENDMSELEIKPNSFISLREFLNVVIPAILLACIIIVISNLWKENANLKLVLAEEIKKNNRESDAASNYQYVLDRYSGAKRTNAYTTSALDVPTSLNQPVSVTLSIDWGKSEKCVLTASGIGVISAEAIFLKPQIIDCGGQKTIVDGLVFSPQARMVHGQLVTIPTTEGKLVPVLRLAKETPLDAWVVVR